MAHDLAEMTAGLASRVDNLAALHTGNASRTLDAQQERLEKLTLAAIALDLDESAKQYTDAIAALDTATNAIGEADAQISNISKVIGFVAKAADLVEKVVKAAAK